MIPGTGTSARVAAFRAAIIGGRDARAILKQATASAL